VTFRDGDGERGSAVVEFALVVPLLLLVALALVQVAVVGRDRVLVEHAARTGARLAAVDPDDHAVRAAVASALPPLDASSATIAIERGGAFGDPVRVRVSYDVPVAMPLAGWLLPSAIGVAADVTMRQEFG
jgi:Flp pilus assembly protein TadG